MTSTIERVAREICKAVEPGAPYGDDEWTNFNREHWHTVARAAIEAMREPDEAMCDTAAEVHNVWGFGATDAATAYRAMIDAALASPPTEREE